MDTLRWILLIVGLAVLAAIYLLGRRGATRRLDDTLADQRDSTDEEGWIDDVRPVARRRDPTLGGQAPSLVAERDELPPAGGAALRVSTGEREESKQLIDVLIIHVQPKGEYFSGNELAAAFDAFDLKFGDKDVYHRIADSGESLFSVVNRLKPGTFNPDMLDELRTPGVSFFLRLPGPDQPLAAFRAMSDCAQRMSAWLDARLLDDDDQPMTAQSLIRYENRIHAYVSATEDDWRDDVRPVRRDPVMGVQSIGPQSSSAQSPSLVADRDELPPAVDASSGMHPAEAGPGEPRFSGSDDAWIDDVSPARPAAPAVESTFAVPSPPSSASEHLDATPEPRLEADEDGWVDDVRPVVRTPAERAALAAQSRHFQGIPERVATTLSTDEEPPPGAREEPRELVDVLIIHLLPKGEFFSGNELAAAFSAFGLSLDDEGVCHRHAGLGEPMFSVVNRLKPGTFNPDTLDDLRTPGVSFFLRLPGPDQPMVAFRAMSDCARRMSVRLNGRLLDENDRPMTPQSFSRYEKRVRTYVSGLYRLFDEATREPPAEKPAERAPATDTRKSATPPREDLRADDATRSPRVMGESAREEPQGADPEPNASREPSLAGLRNPREPSLGEQAGSIARDLLDRYEGRVRSFVDGLKRRSRDDDRQADNAPEWDVLMHEHDAPEPRLAEPPQQTALDLEADSPEPPPAPLSKPRVATAPEPRPVAAPRGRTPWRRTAKPPPDPTPAGPEELLIIHVVADPEIGSFTGEALAAAFNACELEFGAMQIYHRPAKSGMAHFSVVNMIQPGTFDPQHFDTLETPGISLFMQLPGPELPMVAFRSLRDCAWKLAEMLGGRLEDETHSTVTAQTMSHYEERVRGFIQLQARLAGSRR
ncbi:cell division protein ZipA C-terminal FtsZ-binding domain-containing protein [Acidihalobacter ferrooxydans]|uniref:Cell division protein ZipA n=1 Tax=Acidihalobacter ferrooxydans TaxID=1765967 RepID=A0A1P8UHM3_9GAMM|nr:cell division protein ZipA C-terminal FtsZ-binding domain-containing protein [Acidihalobacter ferrooxydans]APZ43281.1 hypothetical protein BW247_09385 [Acidihalobacter ferrooxydans]